MFPALETPRLLLTPRVESDNADLQPLFNDWGIIQNLTDLVPWPYPDNGTEEYFRDLLGPKMASGEELCWAIRLKSDPSKAIGQINLRPTAEEEHRGFWIGQHYWRQGIITEAVAPVTEYWFEVLDKPLLIISARIDNAASNRVKESQGFRLIGRASKPYAGGFVHETLKWELTRDEWRARLNASASPQSPAPKTPS